MSDAPRSRQALLLLLRELARGDTTPERWAAARAGIREGHLGAPSEAVVEDAEGRALPLIVMAAAAGDREMVELLLDAGADPNAGAGAGGSALHAAVDAPHAEIADLLLARGASPLVVRATRESVVRVAHRHGRTPAFELVRRAARASSAASGRHGLATPPSDPRYSLRTQRGVADLRRAAGARLDVLLVDADVKTTARALGDLVESPRREVDVARRPVQDAARLLFVYRLHGIPWTIVPCGFEAASPWTVEQVTELAAPGTGIAPIARALNDAIARRVIHVKHAEHTVYSEHGAIATRGADDEDEADDELAALSVFVPPMRVSTDGHHVCLELLGLDASDVERVDVVVLQELGEPAIDRTVARPTAAPALAQPPLVRPPPAAAPTGGAPPPGPSGAPPLVREPPPIVAEPPIVTEPRASVSAPPIVAEPPIAEPRASLSAPPIVAEPPIAEPRASMSAPPPLVREPPATDTATMSNAPPPIVATPVVANDAPPIVAAPPAATHAPPPIVPPAAPTPPRISEPPAVATPASPPPPAATPPDRASEPPSAAPNAPPPRVHEPPPMVAPAPETSDEDDPSVN